MAENVDDLLAELAKLRRQIANQREEDGRVLGRQEARLDAFGSRLDVFAEMLGAKSPDFELSPWWWPSMRRGEARVAWDLLVPWVDDVLIGRYDTRGTERLATDQTGQAGNLPEGNNLKQCWFAHPDVLDKLSALYWSWKGNYRRRNAADNGPIGFQNDHLDKTLGQIRPKMIGCLGGCARLDGRKTGELSWDHRTAWIRADVDARPSEDA